MKLICSLRLLNKIPSESRGDLNYRMGTIRHMFLSWIPLAPYQGTCNVCAHCTRDVKLNKLWNTIDGCQMANYSRVSLEKWNYQKLFWLSYKPNSVERLKFYKIQLALLVDSKKLDRYYTCEKWWINEITSWYTIPWNSCNKEPIE